MTPASMQIKPVMCNALSLCFAMFATMRRQSLGAKKGKTPSRIKNKPNAAMIT